MWTGAWTGSRSGKSEGTHSPRPTRLLPPSHPSPLEEQGRVISPGPHCCLASCGPPA